MEKYNQQSKCPKCGCEHLTSRFLAKEMIERQCTNCSYILFQLPLDSKETN